MVGVNPRILSGKLLSFVQKSDKRYKFRIIRKNILKISLQLNSAFYGRQNVSDIYEGCLYSMIATEKFIRYIRVLLLSDFYAITIWYIMEYGHDGPGVCLGDGQTEAYLKDMGMTGLASAWAMARRRPI